MIKPMKFILLLPKYVKFMLTIFYPYIEKAWDLWNMSIAKLYYKGTSTLIFTVWTSHRRNTSKAIKLYPRNWWYIMFNILREKKKDAGKKLAKWCDTDNYSSRHGFTANYILHLVEDHSLIYSRFHHLYHG